MEKGMSERFTDIPFQRIVSNGFYLHRLIYWIYLRPFHVCQWSASLREHFSSAPGTDQLE